ncbi:MAG TPA: hypothetical protein PLS90_15195, partial [Candidatus Sumerlaeota bacterium]|nr:hypothetical protein [Candidatus Sumerlaeota bacterium]
DWLGQGHGLFVSGTAPTYVSVMGLEPTSTRVVGGGGQDGFVAAVAAGDYSRHPVYEGFDTNAPIPLVGGGYPPFSDFYGSGGPQAGNPIGEAAPDAGEHPLVEFACGQGRVIAMGWRLPHYGLRPNAHRANLERLTGNVLCYLASGDWYGTIEDGRTRALRAELERITGMMPHACRYAPHLRRGGRLANPFDDDGPRNWLLETDEDGRCLFAYTNADGETRCSIHSAALDLGLEPYHVKPRACALWPLALSEDRPPVLSIQNDCFDFPCNTRRRGRARTLDPGIAELIERNFGKPFLDKLHRLITG